jgi:hypothetical protein
MEVPEPVGTGVGIQRRKAGEHAVLECCDEQESLVRTEMFPPGEQPLERRMARTGDAFSYQSIPERFQ